MQASRRHPADRPARPRDGPTEDPMDDTKTGEPFPSHVGELYLFSLSSYDPVQIEVVVPRVTEADID